MTQFGQAELAGRKPSRKRGASSASPNSTPGLASWRAEILELAEDLSVLEGALVEVNGDQVPKADSLRWIERCRARLTQLAERMSLEHSEKGPRS